MKRVPWVGILIGCLAFIFLAVLPASVASGQQAGTITPSPTRSHTRWPTVTRRPTDTRWPVPPTDTRWPTLTRSATRTRWSGLPTATRWPTVTRQRTATRWPSPTIRPTSTRWPTVTRGPTMTRQPSSTRTPSPTVTLTPTVTMTPTVTSPFPAGWLRYYNGAYNFEFYYPSGSSISEENDTRLVMFFPITPGTNLVSKYLELYFGDPGVGCPSHGGGTFVGNEIINGYRFGIWTNPGDGAAGQRRETTTYSTLQGNVCLDFVFYLHSGMIGAFPTGTPEFDKAAESALFPAVMGTFHLLTPTPTPSTLPLGPFGVVLVQPNDVLNIRTGAGASYTSVGTFAYNAVDVMRTGPTQAVGADTWYQVQNPAGGTGWSNSYYLTEYVTPATFCADIRVQSLFVKLQQAANASSGSQLAEIVSPVHGLNVHLWHSSTYINYTPSQVPGVFTSTTVQNWGSGPSGYDTTGTFAAVIQPELQSVLNAPYESFCNSPNVASMYGEPWPAMYTNFRYYSLFKPGTPGIDLDYKQWMAAVEYVLGKPYLVAIMRVIWEP